MIFLSLISFLIIVSSRRVDALSTVHQCQLGRILAPSEGRNPADWFWASNVVLSNGQVFITHKNVKEENVGFVCYDKVSEHLSVWDSLNSPPQSHTVNKTIIHLSPGQSDWGPKLPSVIVASAFENDYDCNDDNTILDPILVFGIRGFPMHGHIIHNTLATVVGTIWEMNLTPGNVLLYSTKDVTHHYIKKFNEDESKSDILDVGIYSDIFGKISIDNQIHSWKHLVMKSYQNPICIKNLSIGQDMSLDLYNFYLKSDKIQKLSKTILNAYNITSDNNLNNTYIPYCNITILTRKYNRKIVNIDELLDFGRKHFPTCTFNKIIFENMSYKEQISYMHYNTSILIGLDGTGLLNTLYMRPCSVVVRILPWGGNVLALENNFQYQRKGNEFKRYVQFNRMVWLSVSASIQKIENVSKENIKIYNLIKLFLQHNQTQNSNELLLTDTSSYKMTLEDIRYKMQNIPTGTRLSFWKYFMNTIITLEEFKSMVIQALDERIKCNL
jgi:hypothetical protein